MSNVSVTETTYNITVAETDTSVTVSSGDAITVLVDTFSISTSINNTGEGASVGKEILGDTLYLRSIVAGDDIVVVENTDDITISLASTIDANLIGDTQGTHFGNVQGNVTGNVTGDVTGNINSDMSSINVITDLSSITNSTGLTIDTQDVIIKPDGGSVYITTDDFLTYVEVALDDGMIGTQVAVIKGGSGTSPKLHTSQIFQDNSTNTSSFAGDVYMSQDLTVVGTLTGNITGQVTDISNHTTDDLAQGTTNLYYSDTYVETKLGDVEVDIIPGADTTYDLGSSSNRWEQLHAQSAFIDILRPSTGQTSITAIGNIVPQANVTYSLGAPGAMWKDVYVGPGSLYIDGQKVLGSDETGDIDITTDEGQNLHISAGNDIILLPQANASSTQAFTVNLTDINLGPAGGGATVNVNGLLEAPDLHIGDLELEAGLINYAQNNQNLEIRTNGTGYLHANVATTYIGSLTQAVAITGSSIGAVGNTISIVGDLTGDVTGQVSDISNHSTTNLTEGTNLYYTDARVQSVIDTNTAGFITDYTVTESDVTQHQAAITITESQISDLSHYTDTDADARISAASVFDLSDISGTANAGDLLVGTGSGFMGMAVNTDMLTEGSTNLFYTDTRARNAISLTSTNTSELSYDSATGVFSYVSPTTVTASNAVTLQVRNASGVAIGKGDAVYISGHSGNKVLIAKADANATGQYPAIGLAAGAMNNNTDGEVTVYGELAGVNTSTYSVGDVLYLSETAGELTNVRPSSSGTAVQNIGRVARSDSNGIIIISGSGRANDVPNLDSGEVFIGNGSGYEKRALDTDDVAEATNLYYTDARSRAAISATGSLSYNSSTGEISYTQPTNVSAFTNDSGYLTDITAESIFDLTDVYEFQTPADGQILAFSSAAGNKFINVSMTTDDLSEGSTNLYFTDARAIDAIEGAITLSLENNYTIQNTNDGWLWLANDQIYTGQNGQGLTLTNENISAWGTDAVVIDDDLKVNQILKADDFAVNTATDATLNFDARALRVNDAFTLTSFNPYAAYGGTAMPTTIFGAGQESGWAGLTVRSRGEHDWGLGAYGINPDAPRALLALQAGRLDGSSDDYLNTDDLFGQIMANPYSGYRTGVEWLTPSGLLEWQATQDHGPTSGFGTSLKIWTTTNNTVAGATDTSHADRWIQIHGTNIDASHELNFQSEAQFQQNVSFKGQLEADGLGRFNTTRSGVSQDECNTIVGDYVYGGAYDFMGAQIKAGDTAWAGITFSEHAGSGTTKPGGADFTNPGFATEVFGGTPSSPTALGSGKRILSITAAASNDSSGVIPSISNARLLAETTEQQSSTNRGAKWSIHTTPNGASSTQTTLQVREGNIVTIGNSSYDNGNGFIEAGGGDLKLGSRLDTNNYNIINNGGDVTIDDNLQVNNNLTVDGSSIQLGGNVETDTVTITATAAFQGLANFANIDTATLQGYEYAHSQGWITIPSGSFVYVTDGDAGSPCVGVFNGTNFKVVALGGNISSS